jgi:hypothetical protein
MKRFGAIAVLAVLATAALTALAGAVTTSQRPPLREFEGRVVSVDRDARTFRLHDSERGTKRIRVNRNTRYERVDGLSGLKAGQRNIEVKTRRRVRGAWLAIEVERSGGGGEHGGRDDRDDDSSGRGGGGDDD